jgi:glycosyltransferase involved in cell wall biosynthesis
VDTVIEAVALLRAAYGIDAGLRRAYRHYTWRTVAGQVAAIYAAVLAEARAPIAVTQPQE